MMVTLDGLKIGFLSIIGVSIVAILFCLLYALIDNHDRISTYIKSVDSPVNSKIVYEIIEIDGHEFIVLTGWPSSGSGICHKPNCKHCQRESR